MIGPSPLLEFFRRGDVARDVRFLAAQGGLAPRAHEQLAILILLLDDRDPEIRREADNTLKRIPVQALSTFLARSDVSLDMRELFADRGVFPLEGADESAADPLIDTEQEGDADLLGDVLSDEEATRDTIVQRLAGMTFPQRLKAAMKGSREMRSILVRDPNKMIALAVLSSPKLTEPEIESIARMSSVSEDVLRTIGTTRAWIKNYSVVVGLTKNPKTPLAMALALMNRLNDRDLTRLSADRNVPEPLRIAARKRIVSGASHG